MVLKYYTTINTGKGFITHQDNESPEGPIFGHPGNVWTTTNTSWASRVEATEITFEEAQTLVTSSLIGEFEVRATSSLVSGSDSEYYTHNIRDSEGKEELLFSASYSLPIE